MAIMDIASILARIDEVRARADLNDTQISRAAGGSEDLLRNWRRKAREGGKGGVNAKTLSAVADVLGVSAAWLMTGDGSQASLDSTAAQHGLSETAEPFRFQSASTNPDDPLHILRALYGTRTSSPATFALKGALPSFGLLSGDILVVDLARLPEPGEIAIVTISDDDAGTSTTTVRRYMPPFLVPGTADNVLDFIKMDMPGVQVRHPVIGSLRGIETATNGERGAR